MSGWSAPSTPDGWPVSVRTVTSPGQGLPRRDRRWRGCCRRSGCRGDRPSTRMRRASVCSFSGMRGPGLPRPGRRWRGYCGRSGSRGGQSPAPGWYRRGWPRGEEWPHPGGLPSCKTGRGCSAGQGVGMVRAQQPFGFGEVGLEKRNGLIQAAGIAVGVGEVVVGGQGVGSRGPSTRIRSASVCSFSGIARFRSPASW